MNSINIAASNLVLFLLFLQSKHIGTKYCFRVNCIISLLPDSVHKRPHESHWDEVDARMAMPNLNNVMLMMT